MMQILTEDKSVNKPCRSESNDEVAIDRISPKLASTFIDRLKKNRLLNCVTDDIISDDNSNDRRVGTTAQTESDKLTETQASIFVGSGDISILPIIIHHQAHTVLYLIPLTLFI